MKKVILWAEGILFIMIIGMGMYILRGGEDSVGKEICAIDEIMARIGTGIEQRVLATETKIRSCEVWESRKAIWTNPAYALFYGEWERTGKVYVNPGVYQGNSGYINEEEKIQFTREKIVIDGEKKWRDVRYDIEICAAVDDHRIYDTVTLADIGLTKAEGSYYAYVEAEWIEENAESDNRMQLGFWIKDENTLVFCQKGCCIEYRRTSYEGGSEKIFCIEPL